MRLVGPFHEPAAERAALASVGRWLRGDTFDPVGYRLTCHIAGDRIRVAELPGAQWQG